MRPLAGFTTAGTFPANRLGRGPTAPSQTFARETRHVTVVFEPLPAVGAGGACKSFFGKLAHCIGSACQQPLPARGIDLGRWHVFEQMPVPRLAAQEDIDHLCFEG